MRQNAQRSHQSAQGQQLCQGNLPKYQAAFKSPF